MRAPRQWYTTADRESRQELTFARHKLDRCVYLSRQAQEGDDPVCGCCNGHGWHSRRPRARRSRWRRTCECERRRAGRGPAFAAPMFFSALLFPPAVRCPGVGARRDALTACWALAEGGLPEAPRAEPRGRPSAARKDREASRRARAGRRKMPVPFSAASAPHQRLPRPCCTPRRPLASPRPRQQPKKGERGTVDASADLNSDHNQSAAPRLLEFRVGPVLAVDRPADAAGHHGVWS